MLSDNGVRTSPGYSSWTAGVRALFGLRTISAREECEETRREIRLSEGRLTCEERRREIRISDGEVRRRDIRWTCEETRDQMDVVGNEGSDGRVEKREIRSDGRVRRRDVLALDCRSGRICTSEPSDPSGQDCTMLGSLKTVGIDSD